MYILNMKNSKFIIDKFAKLIEQGLVSSKDLTTELFNILKSKRDEFVFKMKLTSKDEFEVLSKHDLLFHLDSNLMDDMMNHFVVLVVLGRMVDWMISLPYIE